MANKLPIRNTGEHPLRLWVEPFLFADHFADTRPEPRRFDYRIPPRTRWWIVAPRELEVQIEIVTPSVEGRGEPVDVVLPSIVVLVHGGVTDVEVIDDAGMVQGYADPPLSPVLPSPPAQELNKPIAEADQIGHLSPAAISDQDTWLY